MIENIAQLLELPEIDSSLVEQPKRAVRTPSEIEDSLTMNEEQRQVYDGLIDDIVNKTHNILTLEGFAGVGKTYVTSALVENIIASNPGMTVAMTAPTNKAVKVLQRAGAYQHPNLSYLTIHSLLGLREQITPQGEQIFVQVKPKHGSQASKIEGKSLIVVDEGSMIALSLCLGSTKITGLFEYAKLLDFTLLFVGDPEQIPPIGEDSSVPFTERYRQEYDIKRYVLNTIVRQAEGNPIIKITKQVREAKLRPISFPLREHDILPNGDGVYFLNGDDVTDFWRLIETYFMSENFKHNSDFVKVIAYTNKAVDSFNSRIRKLLYGNDVPKITIGEKLIANTPIKSIVDEALIILTTGDEFEVVDLEVTSGNFRGAELNFYDLTVGDLTAGTPTKKIRVVHESSEDDFKLILEHLANTAKEAKGSTWEASAAWKTFYVFKELFADVKYNYAITAHKSQGSTYNNAFVLESDIDRSKKISERNRIKYTACTRPKNKLFVVE